MLIAKRHGSLIFKVLYQSAADYASLPVSFWIGILNLLAFCQWNSLLELKCSCCCLLICISGCYCHYLYHVPFLKHMALRQPSSLSLGMWSTPSVVPIEPSSSPPPQQKDPRALRWAPGAYSACNHAPLDSPPTEPSAHDLLHVEAFEVKKCGGCRLYVNSTNIPDHRTVCGQRQPVLE